MSKKPKKLTESDKFQILKCLDGSSSGQMNDLTLNFAIERYLRLTKTEGEDIVFINSFRLMTLARRIDYKLDEKKKLKILGIKRNLSEYKIVFLLIFNNGFNNKDEVGHWSLLVYLPNEEERFYHYDSLLTVNTQKSVYYIKLLQDCELIDPEITFNNPEFIIEQRQHWECAYHVLFYMWIFIKEYRNYDTKSTALSKKDILIKYKCLFEVDSAMKIKKTLFEEVSKVVTIEKKS